MKHVGLGSSSVCLLLLIAARGNVMFAPESASAHARVILRVACGSPIPTTNARPEPELSTRRRMVLSPASSLLIHGRRANLRLVLNIPAYRLDVFEDGVRTRSFVVAVGSARYPTPRGSFSITQVEWNPWWIPPATDWARNQTAMPPGSQNPMGPVKLQFRTYYFLHGTPLEQSLGTAVSHGCVRMAKADAVALARLVQHHAGPDIDDVMLDSLLADTTLTRRYTLNEPVPLEVRYDVAELCRDSLWLYPDVYGLVVGQTAALALAAIANDGYDTTGVDRTALDAAVRNASRGPTTLALTVLLPRSAISPSSLGRDRRSSAVSQHGCMVAD